MTVFVIHSLYSDGDGYTACKYLATAASLETAKKIVALALSKVPQGKRKYIESAPSGSRVRMGHDSMNKENNYTYIGSLSDCNNSVSCSFAGFVITHVEPLEDLNQLEIGENSRLLYEIVKY